MSDGETSAELAAEDQIPYFRGLNLMEDGTCKPFRLRSDRDRDRRDEDERTRGLQRAM